MPMQIYDIGEKNIMAVKTLYLVLEENGEETARIPLSPKQFKGKDGKPGRVGYYANGKFAIGGVEHTSNLMFIRPDPSLQRANESNETYAGRLAEMRAKSKGRNGPVRTIKAPSA